MGTVAAVDREAPRVEPRRLARPPQAKTGVKSMPYEDLAREALCFGWVDSLVKPLDDDRYALSAYVSPANGRARRSIHRVLSADVNCRVWAAHCNGLRECRVLNQFRWIQMFNLHGPLCRARACETRDEHKGDRPCDGCRQLPAHGCRSPKRRP